MDPLQSVAAQSVFGLYGDQRTLVLNTLCAHRSLVLSGMAMPSTAQQSGTIHGDLKTVAYFVTGNGAGSSSGQVQGDTAAPTSGLARLEGDHLAVGYSMMQSGSIASQARVIAPEVMSIAFRYFDGTQWQTTWDAALLQILPVAIECTITVRPPDETLATSPPTAATAQVQPRVYRQVIAVSTMAQPVPISQLATLPTQVVP
jgi:hypothetical protein